MIAWLTIGAAVAVWAEAEFIRTHHKCRRINDIVKDIEAGDSQFLGAGFTLIESKTERIGTVRRYSVAWPTLGASKPNPDNIEPFEIMQLEIVDVDDPYAKAREEKLATRWLRIRPPSGSHWVTVKPSAVAWVFHHQGAYCVQDKGKACGHLTIQFESRAGALAVEFVYSEGLPKFDHVRLSVGESLCTTPEAFDP